VPGKEG